MKFEGEISQIRSDFQGEAATTSIWVFDAGSGGIGVRTPVGFLPTYRARKGRFIYLLQFISKEWAREYLAVTEYDFVEELSNPTDSHNEPTA